MSEKLPCYLPRPSAEPLRADCGQAVLRGSVQPRKGRAWKRLPVTRSPTRPLPDAIKVYNKSRAARREFVKLANEHCDVITPTKRSAVLKAAWFMEKAGVHRRSSKPSTPSSRQLPAAKWNGAKVVTSGIICDNPTLLEIFEDNNVAIAADDVRPREPCLPRGPLPQAKRADPMTGARRCSSPTSDYDVLLYDPAVQREPPRRVRGQHGQGDPARRAWCCSCSSSAIRRRWSIPYLKKALDAAGIPFIKLGIDQQMRDFGQAATAIQAFADVAFRAVREVSSYSSCRARQEGKAVKNAQKVHTRLQIEQSLCYNPN